MSLLPISLVFAGGGLGAAARYLLGGVIAARLGSVFPWGTLVINGVGSLAIGLVTGLIVQHPQALPLRLFLVTGLLGGFTTFSAFSLETMTLVQNGKAIVALAYVGASLLLCLLGCALGLRLTGVTA
jgi:fluoride exporter